MSEARDHGPDRGRDHRLGPLPRPLALALIGVWALLTIVALIATLRTGPAWSGEREGLLPEHDRSPEDRVLVLLRVDVEAQPDDRRSPEDDTSDEDELDPRTLLAEAGFAIEEAFPDRRVPLAPPKTEITRWLDAHALYLLPIETHAALAERLADEAMRAQVQGLVARLSSPLYAVSGDQPRRDPLAVHELGDDQRQHGRQTAGRLGHVAEVPGSDAPQVSANGDLISAGGDRALIALLSEPDDDLEQLRTELEAAIEPLPISIALIHPRVQQTQLARALQRDAPALIGACLAGLVLLLSLSLRKVAPVLVLVGLLGSIALVLSWAAPGLDVLSLAVVILALGLACDLALQLPSIGKRRLAAPLIVAGALAPLWLSPYPLWHGWAVVWPAALLIAALVLRLVFPALLALLGSELTWRPATLRWTPSALVALLVCVGLCSAAVGVAPKLAYRAQLPAQPDPAELERELIEHFFDPSMIVEARTRADAEPDDAQLGSPAAAALDAAASDFEPLAQLVPGEARRIDSPASFVLPRTELEARKQALAQLKLGERMDMLKVLLAERGLRAEAFSEFVHGAADIEDLPSAAAALDGPLGPWIRAYLTGEGDETELRMRVELRGRASLPMVTFSRERMAELPSLRGPAIAAMVDQRELARRLGLVLVAGAWLTALLVWLGTASLGIALAAALVGVTSQAGVVIGLSLLEQPIGPQLLPVLLVVATAGALAGARACASLSRDEPIAWPPILTAAGCLLVAGAALLSSAQPLWRELGVALAIGSVLACLLGLFVTPGLARLLRGLPSPKPAEAKA